MPTESQSNDHIQAWPASALAGLRQRVEQAERERDTAIAQRDAALSENEDLEDIVFQQAELCRLAVEIISEVGLPACRAILRTFRPIQGVIRNPRERDSYTIALSASQIMYTFLVEQTGTRRMNETRQQEAARHRRRQQE